MSNYRSNFRPKWTMASTANCPVDVRLNPSIDSRSVHQDLKPHENWCRSPDSSFLHVAHLTVDAIFVPKSSLAGSCISICGCIWQFCTLSFKKISDFFPHGNRHLLGLSLSFLEHCGGDSKDYEQYEKEPVPVVPMRWLIHMVGASRWWNIENDPNMRYP